MLHSVHYVVRENSTNSESHYWHNCPNLHNARSFAKNQINTNENIIEYEIIDERNDFVVERWNRE